MPHKKEKTPQLNKVKNFFQKRKCLKNTEMPQKKETPKKEETPQQNKVLQFFLKNGNASKKTETLPKKNGNASIK